MKRKPNVRIIYKSGATIDIHAPHFKVTKSGGTVTGVEWGNDARPRPLHVGVDDIAAVWELR